ncbi:hypothetical protein, partial [Staphylococcus aureus]
MRNKNYIGGLTKENLKGFVILVLIFLYVLSALLNLTGFFWGYVFIPVFAIWSIYTVSYTHLRAHETTLHLVCRLLLEKTKRPSRFLSC